MVWHGAKYSHGAWERFPDIVGKSRVLRFPATFVRQEWCWRHVWNCYFLQCLCQSATGKMTALTIGSYHVFCKPTDLLGKTLPNQESGWLYHFPSLCIIDLILCGLIISRLFVLEDFVLLTRALLLGPFATLRVPFGALWVPFGGPLSDLGPWRQLNDF